MASEEQFYDTDDYMKNPPGINEVFERRSRPPSGVTFSPSFSVTHTTATEPLPKDEFSTGESDKEVSPYKSFRDSREEVFDLYDDIYSMMFLSRSLCSTTMIFAVATFLLKICLYVFLGAELGRNGKESFDTGPKDRLVLAAQFFMLPVAVAIQEDLIGSYALLANIKYDKSILQKAPGATQTKWVIASMFRFVDGMFSLAINFVLLLQATEVLGLFLNFAALQFLQTIDNMAFGLAKDGYLGESIEDIAELAMTLTLPKKDNQLMNVLDTVFFLLTFLLLLISWVIVVIRQQYGEDTFLDDLDFVTRRYLYNEDGN